MDNKKLIIFDMDGTLINSGNVIANTINFVRVNIGLDPMPKDKLLRDINDPTINAAEYFYGTKEFTTEQTELFTQYYDEHCISDIELYDGIKELLEYLEEKYILTIATNASVEFAKKMVKYLSIDHYFDYIIGANCVEKPKPSADMLLKTIEDIGVNKSQTVLIGDSDKDRFAAIEANIEYLIVNWGFTDHKDGINNPKILQSFFI